MALPQGTAALHRDVDKFLKATQHAGTMVKLRITVRLDNRRLNSYWTETVAVCSNGVRWRVVYGRYMSPIYEIDKRPKRVVLKYGDEKFLVSWLNICIRTDKEARIIMPVTCGMRLRVGVMEQFGTDDFDTMSFVDAFTTRYRRILDDVLDTADDAADDAVPSVETPVATEARA